MDTRNTRTPIAFLIVTAYSVISFLVIPSLPSDAAKIGVSVWGAAVSAAGFALAIYCLRRKQI